MFCSTSDLYFQALRWLSLGKNPIFCSGFSETWIVIVSLLRPCIGKRTHLPHLRWPRSFWGQGGRSVLGKGLSRPWASRLSLLAEPSRTQGSRAPTACALTPLIHPCTNQCPLLSLHGCTVSQAATLDNDRGTGIHQWKQDTGHVQELHLHLFSEIFIYIYICKNVCVCICLCI